MFTLLEKLKFKIGFFILDRKYIALYKLANGRCGGAPMLYKKDSKEILEEEKRWFKQEKVRDIIHIIVKDNMWMAFYDAEGDEFAMNLIKEYCSKLSDDWDRFF